MAGYPSFGHSMFFGIGAYVSAIVMVRYRLPMIVAIPASAIVTAVFSLAFAPLFKPRGFYFALSTLALSLVVDSILLNWTWVSGMKPPDHGWRLTNNPPLHFLFFVFFFLLF